MKILVVSPHPDDETLGAGGTLLKQKKSGDQLFWLIVTHVNAKDGWDEDFVERRKNQINEITNTYGFDEVFDLGYPPACLSCENEKELVSKIYHVYEQIKPEWLIIPGEYDAHSDHGVTFRCCMAAAKPFRAPYIKKIVTMEIISETEQGYQKDSFIPNYYVDISEEIESKIQAMKIYDSELDDMPFPRNIENLKALAVFRGGCCNALYAEAFHLVRLIE